MYKAIDNAMVTEWVNRLPHFCFYCKGRCWKTDSYPYAVRCSDCGAYFHKEPIYCENLEGYDLHWCCACCHTEQLVLFEIHSIGLVEICCGAIEWLVQEEYLNKGEISYACREWLMEIG
jgi:hypothetical protein